MSNAQSDANAAAWQALSPEDQQAIRSKLLAVKDSLDIRRGVDLNDCLEAGQDLHEALHESAADENGDVDQATAYEIENIVGDHTDSCYEHHGVPHG